MHSVNTIFHFKPISNGVKGWKGTVTGVEGCRDNGGGGLLIIFNRGDAAKQAEKKGISKKHK
jgi:hypothetical protein